MRTIGLKPGDRVLVVERRDGDEVAHNALAISISMDTQLAGQQGEMAIDAVFVPPPAWGTELRFVTMQRIVHISHPDWRTDVAGFAYEELPPQSGVCMFCGCTELRPCVDANGFACRWMDRKETVCSAMSCLDAMSGELAQMQAEGLELL